MHSRRPLLNRWALFLRVTMNSGLLSLQEDACDRKLDCTHQRIERCVPQNLCRRQDGDVDRRRRVARNGKGISTYKGRGVYGVHSGERSARRARLFKFSSIATGRSFGNATTTTRKWMVGRK